MFHLYPVDMRLMEKQFENAPLPVDMLNRARQLLELEEFSNPFLYYHGAYLLLWLIAKVFHDGERLRGDSSLSLAAVRYLNQLRTVPIKSDLLPEQVYILLLHELVEVALRFATEHVDMAIPGVAVTFFEELLEALENL